MSSWWLAAAPEIGLFCLLLAGAAGLALALYPLLPRLPQLRSYKDSAAPLLDALPKAQFAGAALAFLCLEASLLHNDFSVAYVQANSHTDLPLPYKISALWGAHEGSLLLWILLLAVWTLAAPKSDAADKLPARSLLGAVTCAFIAFTALTSNPFARLLPLAPDIGSDLNPLLQHPGLAVHPPLLYAGYTGTALAFALGLGMLASGRFGRTELLRLRAAALLPLSLLTAGIALGSWWAYQELGWGGWWFWDPVENLSVLPWLAMAALLHSCTSTLASGSRQRDLRLGLTLAVLGFPLAVLGAFMVRSGLLISVHSFSSDPSRGLFLLLLLALITVPAVLLLLARLPQTSGTPRPFSAREALLLAAATLMLLAAATILLGTLYPLLYEVLTGERAALGAPWYERVLAPVFILTLLGLALAPLSRWGKPWRLPPRAGWWAAAGGALGMLLPLAYSGQWLWRDSALCGLCGVAFAWLSYAALRRLGWLQPGLPQALQPAPPVRWRMWLAHFGALLAIVGATLQGGLGDQREVLIAVGEQLETPVGTLHFARVEQVETRNYSGERMVFELVRNGGGSLYLYPEKRTYAARRQVLTEAAIERVGVGDLYLAVGRRDDSGAWSLRVHYKPFMDLLWFGILLMVLAMAWPRSLRWIGSGAGTDKIAGGQQAKTDQAGQAGKAGKKTSGAAGRAQ